MTLFQWITLPLLAGLAIADSLSLANVTGRRGFCLLRVAVWLTAAICVAFPAITVHLAHVLGIGRGADLASYVSILLFIGAALYFYRIYLSLQRQVTELVRRLAIREAEFGGTIGPRERGDG